jgi:protein TonB
LTGALTQRGDLPQSLALALALHLAGLLLAGVIRDPTPPSLVPPRATRVSVHLKAVPQQAPEVTARPHVEMPSAVQLPSPVAAPPLPAARERVAPARSVTPPPPAAVAPARLAAVPSVEPETIGDLLPQARIGSEAIDGDFDVAPRQRQTIRPVYPRESRERGESGIVVAMAHVTADGRVARVEITRSSGYPALDRAARNALLAARFSPARRGNTTVPARVRIPFEFKLTER